MGGHCNYAPSSAHRWLKCPGCIQLSMKAGPGESSEAARIGTAAHHFGEWCLEHGKDPMTTEATAFSGVIVDDVMRKAVKVYVDYAEGIWASNSGYFLETEQRVSTEFDKVKVYGTADIVACENWGTLEIVDYKNGRGVVEVEDNAQLILYGIMALEEYADWQPCEVKITIVQPNVSHKDGPIRSQVYQLEELDKWREKFADAVALAEGQPDLYIPGSHCHWCRGATACPALQKKANELAKVEFAEIEMLSPEEVKHFFDMEKPVFDFFKELKKSMVPLMTDGTLQIDGYRAVQGYGHPKWSDPEAVALLMKSKKLNAADMYSKTLITPKQAVKKFGASHREWIEEQSKRNETTVRIEKTGADEKTAKEDFND